MIYYQEKLLTIRTWQEGDEPFIAHHANNVNIWRYLMNSFPFPYTYDDAISWVSLNKESQPALNMALVFDGEPVGSIGLIPGTDVYAKSMNLGYWVSEEYWGKGIASAAIKWMISYAFSTFEVKRLAASVFSNNPASMHLLIKNGFQQEAVLKDAIFKDNQVLDEHIFKFVGTF